MLSKKEDKKDSKQATYKKYSVDFTNPLENKLLTLESVLKYLQSNMKLNGLKGKLGKSILINADERETKIKTALLFLWIAQLNSLKDILDILLKNS